MNLRQVIADQGRKIQEYEKKLNNTVSASIIHHL